MRSAACAVHTGPVVKVWRMSGELSWKAVCNGHQSAKAGGNAPASRNA